MQPGDLLRKEGAHVALIVGVDESSKTYITAEAMGAKYGVTYSRRSFTEPGYDGIDMTQYYSTHAR